MINYKTRNDIVYNLGFPSYDQYLNSKLWKKIKKNVFSKRGKKCTFCKSKKNITVHHERYTYENLSGESEDFLWPICDKCHQKIHFTKKGKFRNSKESHNVFYQKLSTPKKIQLKKEKQKKKKQRKLKTQMDIQKKENDLEAEKMKKYF